MQPGILKPPLAVLQPDTLQAELTIAQAQLRCLCVLRLGSPGQRSLIERLNLGRRQS